MLFLFKIILFYLTLITVAATPILNKKIFPFYDFLHTVAPIYLRAQFNGNPNVQYWTKIAWWASFVAGDGGLVDNVNVGIDACQSCIANHQSPNFNCRNDIVSLVKMSITNVTKGVVGWMSGYGANGVDGNGSPVKRQLSNRSGDADIDTFDPVIENWTSNNITRHLATAHIRSGAKMLSKSSINDEDGNTVRLSV